MCRIDEVRVVSSLDVNIGTGHFLLKHDCRTPPLAIAAKPEAELPNNFIIVVIYFTLSRSTDLSFCADVSQEILCVCTIRLVCIIGSSDL